jgi:hypothetical protein
LHSSVVSEYRDFSRIRCLGLTFGPQGIGFPFRLGAGGTVLAFRGRRHDFCLALRQGQFVALLLGALLLSQEFLVNGHHNASTWSACRPMLQS